MRRTAGVVLAALALSAGARAGEPDLRSEIAWARATWPDELKGLHFHAPLAALLAWAPRRGSVPVYLYTEDFACRRASLMRADPPEMSEDDRAAAAADDDDVPVPPSLLLRINHRPQVGDGKQFRYVTSVEVGVRLAREDGPTIIEARGADGRWDLEQSGGIAFDPIVYGALSSVDDRVARWDGEPQAVHPYCSGPLEWLACPTGGERPCERCEEVSVMVTYPHSMWGHGHDHGNRPITCHDRCPDYPKSPDLDRLDRLTARVEIWRPRKAPVARVPSLYKFRDDCLREYPAAAR